MLHWEEVSPALDADGLDELKSAQAAREIAATRFRRSEEVSKKGYGSQSEIDVARAKLVEADARVKQIESIVEIASPKSAMPKGTGKDPR